MGQSSNYFQNFFSVKNNTACVSGLVLCFLAIIMIMTMIMMIDSINEDDGDNKKNYNKKKAIM
jgi:hypothetical protein